MAQTNQSVISFSCFSPAPYFEKLLWLENPIVWCLAFFCFRSRWCSQQLPQTYDLDGEPLCAAFTQELVFAPTCCGTFFSSSTSCFKAIDGALTHVSCCSETICKVSMISRFVLSLDLAKIEVALSGASQLHFAECAARLPGACSCPHACLCPPSLSFKNLPVCPMQYFLHVSGILYITPSAHSTNLRLCFT